MGSVQTARATLQASGPGSVLALPNLTSIAGSTAFNSDLYLQALGGGQLKLGGVTAVTAGSVNLQADGASSLLDLSSLASYQGYIETVVTTPRISRPPTAVPFARRS